MHDSLSSPTPDSAFPPDLPPPLLSTWPKVLGIISIALGAVSLFTGLISVMGQETIKAAYEGMHLPDGFFARHEIALRVLPGVAAGLGLLLLLGGILLLLRRSPSRGLLLLWALLKIGFAGVQAHYNLALQKDLLPVMLANQPKTQGVDTETIISIVSTVGVVVGVLWLAALPIFFIVWFFRGKIRAEMAMWQR